MHRHAYSIWRPYPRSHAIILGQVYYTLLQEREEKGIKDVAISRVEQISPFPYDLVAPHLDTYPNADLLWCQEEPLNNGAWTYIAPRILTAANETQYHKGKYPLYAGREPTSSVATGSKVGPKFSLLNRPFDRQRGTDSAQERNRSIPYGRVCLTICGVITWFEWRIVRFSHVLSLRLPNKLYDSFNKCAAPHA